MSSNDPNLQNIPTRTDEGREIRRGFVARPGHVFVAADYSQIELRVLAHITQDPNLLQAFAEDQDIHTATAAQLFSVPIEQVSKNQRRISKTVVFGGHLWDQRLRPGRAHGSEPHRGPAADRGAVRALPRPARLHRQHAGRGPPAGLRPLAVRPAPLDARPDLQRAAPPGRRARGDQRAHPGHRRRHYEDRHDPRGRGAAQAEAGHAHAAPGPRRADLRGAAGRGRSSLWRWCASRWRAPTPSCACGSRSMSSKGRTGRRWRMSSWGEA